MVTATKPDTTRTGSGEGKKNREPPHLAEVPIAEIAESPHNPRKIFSDADIEELAQSIREQGVLQPVRVRPARAPLFEDADYELVFGARRLRAAKLAGLERIPAIVGELDDSEVAEAQMVENDQRTDVHPLERAQAYQRMLDVGGEKASAAWIAGRVGRDKATVCKSLKLLELAPAVRDAWLRDFPSMTQAVIIHFARLKPEQQWEAFRDYVAECGDYGPSSRTVGPWLRARYFLRLADAPFDPKAKNLTVAGACTTCEKNTEHAAKVLDLFHDAELNPQAACTDRGCWKEKADAEWLRRCSDAKLEVVELNAYGEPADPKIAERLSPTDSEVNLYDPEGEDDQRTLVRDLVAQGKVRVVATGRDKDGKIIDFVDETALGKIERELQEAINAKRKAEAKEASKSPEHREEAARQKERDRLEKERVKKAEERAARDKAVEDAVAKAIAAAAAKKPPTLALLLAALSFSRRGYGLPGLPAVVDTKPGALDAVALADRLLVTCTKMPAAQLHTLLLREAAALSDEVVERFYAVDRKDITARVLEAPAKPAKQAAKQAPKAKPKKGAKR